jgi:hypothetical protein
VRHAHLRSRLYWVSPFIVCEDCMIDHVQHECAWGRTPFQLHIVAIFIEDAHPPELSTTQVFVGSILNGAPAKRPSGRAVDRRLESVIERQ